MSSILMIILSAVLLSVAALSSNTGGWRPFADSPDLYRNALALAAISLVVVPTAALASWLLATFVLAPLELLYLRTPVVVMITFICVALAEAHMRRQARRLPSRPGFAFLLCGNSLGIGLALFVQERMRDVFSAIVIPVLAAGLFALLLLCFVTLYERIRYAHIPEELRGAPIALFTAGIMALAFMGFTGLVQE